MTNDLKAAIEIIRIAFDRYYDDDSFYEERVKNSIQTLIDHATRGDEADAEGYRKLYVEAVDRRHKAHKVADDYRHKYNETLDVLKGVRETLKECADRMNEYLNGDHYNPITAITDTYFSNAIDKAEKQITALNAIIEGKS